MRNYVVEILDTKNKIHRTEYIYTIDGATALEILKEKYPQSKLELKGYKAGWNNFIPVEDWE